VSEGQAPRRRIALVLASSTGGIGRHVASLAEGLIAAGDAVTVLGPAATQEQFGFTGLGAAFAPVEIPASPQPADAVAVRALRRRFAAADPQVVHAHGLRAGLVAALARPNRALPLAVTWHNRVLATGLRRALYARVERYVATAADVTLGASADLVERVQALGGRDVRLGAVAAPSPAPPARTPAEVRAEFGLTADQPVILGVGRLHRQKRHDLLVTAAARWAARRDNPVVLVAGSGPEYTALAAQILTTRAPVVLAGHRTDVPDLLSVATVAVVTSDWEARQLFAQEALRAGAPLVATAVGGLPDLVADAGVLIPPGDLDALDAAVTGLLDDPAARAAYIRKGRVRAATWPTEADTVAQVSAVYGELIGAASRTGGAASR
jgi:glycosyltransferase involved in cell wall biosynthesis